MEFITIDFETATRRRDSACEIGLTVVKDNNIIDAKNWLIKPKYNDFEYFNILIHGIRPENVKDKPEFYEIWDEIKTLIENKLIIAHNASFDISVLRKTLDLYNLSYPSLNYICSYISSKQIWKGLPSYDLKTLCKFNNIEFKHHRAGSDSYATAKLMLKAFEITEVKNIEDIPNKLNTSIGQLFNGGYKPSESKKIKSIIDVNKIIGDPNKVKIESIFYKKYVVFTGALSSMSRSEAQQIIANIGGLIGSGVTKETNFLIVGQQDYRIVGEDGMSSKQEKAIKLIEKGIDIEILSEEDFLKNL